MFTATRNGLGIYVNEMQRTINGLGCNACEAGGYYNARITPYGHFRSYRPDQISRGLGDVPNDFEASVDLQYIPVRQGWYYGYPVDGSGYPDARNGLGQAGGRRRRGQLAQAAAVTSGDPAALATLAKMEGIQTFLQVISTLSIATVATLAVVRAVRSRKSREPFLGDDD